MESVSVHTVPDSDLKFTLQAIWSTRNLSSGTEVSHPNHKHLLCMPILLWYQVLHHQINLRIKNTLWCSNASKAECALAQIKGWFISVPDSPIGPPKLLVESILPLLLIKYLQPGELSHLRYNHTECRWCSPDFQSISNIPILPMWLATIHHL